ncbi:hypothetical protein D3C78_581810 [compost metagenome]
MAAALIELQARQITHKQPRITLLVLYHMHRIRLFRVVMGETMHLVDQHRVALLGHEQALAGRVIGQAFETLVAVQANAQGQLLGILGVEKRRVVVQAHANQALFALVGDHVSVGADVFHRLRVAKPGQRHAPQNAPVQRQLDQLRAFIGNGKQAIAIGVEGQRRNVFIQAFDRLGFKHYLVLVQTNALLERLPPGLDVEPAAFEQTVLLPGHSDQEQGEQAQYQENQRQADVAAHSGGLFR